ncbi:hypothetical protein PAHAL_6G088400 [Panicum hallii]|jgi:hypothetical protein|uniref:Uncharacterized protein n=1 Tax=Panicum hallii TaxID=206008 RepID=A0A2S3I1D6_9POAL|nr:hypothetical protein PAHAL_6G088400 [Panicum hallii]
MNDNNRSLSFKRQLRPSTLERSNLILQVQFWIHFHPSSELNSQVGIPHHLDAWSTIANVTYALVAVGFPPLDAQQLFFKVFLDKQQQHKKARLFQASTAMEED